MAVRRVAAILLAISLALSVSAAAAGVSQLFGRRGLGDSYSGVEAIASTQDPYMVCCADFFSAGPIALVNKNASDQPFIEGGNEKFWDTDVSPARFDRRAYWSYNPGGNAQTMGSYFPSVDLQPATYYKYTIYPTGTPGWFYVRFCYGSNYQTCYILQTIYMGRDYFTHTTVGGEGSCEHSSKNPNANSCSIGYIADRSNRFLEFPNSQWYSYCYTETTIDVDTNYPYSFGPCGPYPAPDWTLNYR